MEYTSEIEDFKTMFEYLMSRIRNNPNYELKMTSRTISLIKTFLKKMNIRSNESIWQYLIFCVVMNDNRYSNKNALSLSNCLSTTKILRWKNRNSKQMYLSAKFERQRGYQNPLKEEGGLSKRYLDDLRQKYFNTSRGYIICQDYEGMLFDNFKCNVCRYFETCKQQNE